MDLKCALALYTTAGELLPGEDTWGVNEFPDGQHQFWIKKSIVEAKAFWMTCCLRSAEAMDICLQAISLLKPKLAAVKVVYLYGGRSDKWEAGDNYVSNTAEYAMKALIAAGVEQEKLTILDPHHIKGPSTIVTRDWFGVDLSKYTLIMYPDVSAYERFFYLHPSTLPAIVCAKKRDQVTSELLEHVVPLFNYSEHSILVADDLCDGGKTFISLAEKMNVVKMGEVDLYTTHGLYTNGAVEKLRKAGYNHLFTTNSFHRNFTSVGNVHVHNVWKP